MNRREAIRAIGGTAAVSLVAAGAPARALDARSLATLYKNAIVIDGNLMAPIDPSAHLDAAASAQLKASGLTALKMTLGGSGDESKADVDADIAAMDKGIQASSDLYMKIQSAADFDVAKKTGRVGIIYSFEAAAMLEGRVENIDHFRKSGVLVMGLSYNGPSPFASGVLSPKSSGLTPLGHEAVRRMNALGVTVDLSHSDEESSLGTLDVSSRPTLITHAGCSAVYAHPRNKSDTLLRALADKGGVVGIYELSYLTKPPAQPSLDDYLCHLEHALRICGEDHVGIGSDCTLTPFDTSPASMAEWNKLIQQRKAAGVAAPGEGPPPFVLGLNRPDRSAIIADALARRGYRGRVIEKVLGANFRRVFVETWTAA